MHASVCFIAPLPIRCVNFAVTWAELCIKKVNSVTIWYVHRKRPRTKLTCLIVLFLFLMIYQVKANCIHAWKHFLTFPIRLLLSWKVDGSQSFHGLITDVRRILISAVEPICLSHHSQHLSQEQPILWFKNRRVPLRALAEGHSGDSKEHKMMSVLRRNLFLPHSWPK